jgi:hypothetical protein
MTTQSDPDDADTREAAKFFRTTEQTVRRWCAAYGFGWRPTPRDK